MSRALASEKVQVALVLLFAAIVVTLPAGRRPIWDGNEARYALLARDILERGSWLVAHVRDEPYVYKPQLFYWLVAALSWPSGRVTPWTAALPAVASTVAGVGGVVAVGRLLWGGTAGILGGLIYATTPLVFTVGHEAVPDALLNAWMVWAFYWVLRGAGHAWPSSSLLGFAACFLGALLSKGPAALALLVAVGATIAHVGRPPVLRLAVSAALALGVAALVWVVPYAVYARTALEHGVMKGEYLSWFDRWPLRSRLPSLYAPLVAFLPWTLLLAAAPWHWRVSPDHKRRLVAVWTVSLWAVIALSGRYRAKYLLPVSPGLALLAAEFLAARLDGRARTARQAALAGAALFAVGGLVTARLPAARRLIDIDNQPYLLEAPWEWTVSGLAVVAAALALLAAARRDAALIGALALALAVGTVLVVEGIGYPARYARHFDVTPIAHAAAALVPAGGTVVGYPDLSLCYDFYLPGRRVREASEPSRLADSPGTTGAIIMPASRWRTLADKLPPGWEVVAARDVRGNPMIVVGRP